MASAKTIYVSGSAGRASDSNSGLSSSAPLKTLGRASELARPGDTVLIGAGTYREALRPYRSGAPGKTITYSAAPGAERRVFIVGSVRETHWSSLGGGVWETAFVPLSQVVYPASWPEKYRSDSLSRRREMVEVAGKRFLQVLSRDELRNGRFFVDTQGSRLLIQLDGDPRTQRVEVAKRTQGIFAQGRTHLVFRGLVVRNVANDRDEAAVQLDEFSRIENCVIKNNNQVGLKITGNTVVENTEASSNGRIGLAVAGSHNRVLDSTTSYNSWRFGPFWDAAGVKVISRNPENNEFLRHTAIGNRSPGIWFDTVGGSNRVEGSWIQGNLVAGLHMEAGQGDNLFANNVVIGTRPSGVLSNPQEDGVGINLRDTNGLRVFNNTIVSNSRAGILVSGGDRAGGTIFTANSNIKNNILDRNAGPGIEFWLWRASREHALTHKVNFNLFNNNSTTARFPVVGQSYGHEDLSFAQWRELGFGRGSRVASPAFVCRACNNFKLQEDSPALDRAAPLAAVNQDFLGRARPVGPGPDMGAFERRVDSP